MPILKLEIVDYDQDVGKIELIPITRIYRLGNIYNIPIPLLIKRNQTLYTCRVTHMKGCELSSESLLKSHHRLWNILWNDLRWYYRLQHLEITFQLLQNYLFMSSLTSYISIRMVHLMKKTFPNIYLSSHEDVSFIHAPTFPDFFCISSFTSSLCFVTPSHTVHSTPSFWNSPLWLVIMKSYHKIGRINTEQRANCWTQFLSPSQYLSYIYDQHNYPIHCSFIFNNTKESVLLLKHKTYLHHCTLVLPSQRLMSCVDKIKFTSG